MRISVSLTIEVDPGKWDAVYGRGSSPAEVREDVREYILNAVQGSPGIEESDAEVTLR
jgi:hypothetical protein